MTTKAICFEKVLSHGDQIHGVGNVEIGGIGQRPRGGFWASPW
jgi:hypothetical protein